jgi:hypothetical protein
MPLHHPPAKHKQSIRFASNKPDTQLRRESAFRKRLRRRVRNRQNFQRSRSIVEPGLWPWLFGRLEGTAKCRNRSTEAVYSSTLSVSEWILSCKPSRRRPRPPALAPNISASPARRDRCGGFRQLQLSRNRLRRKGAASMPVLLCRSGGRVCPGSVRFSASGHSGRLPARSVLRNAGSAVADSS